MFQKAEVLYFVFFVTRNVKLGFWGFWQVESEPRKPKSVKIQSKMVSQASEGDLMYLGSLPVPLIDSSCTKTRSRSLIWCTVGPSDTENTIIHHLIRNCSLRKLEFDRECNTRNWIEISSQRRENLTPMGGGLSRVLNEQSCHGKTKIVRLGSATCMRRIGILEFDVL